MKTKLLIISALLAIGSTNCVQAQGEIETPGEEEAGNEVEAHLKADVVNKYIWRGLDLGHVSLQPEMSVGWRGLSLSAWGSVGLNDKNDNSEIDLTLSYETGGLSFGIVDYWNDANDKRYFYYKTMVSTNRQDGTGHSFEGFVSYDFGPLTASWQTFFAGNDYQEDDGKRAYSSYFELTAPFTLATCNWDAAFGLVPWKCDYYDTSGFSVTNLSLRATKDIQISKSFALPLFGQLIANPASQHFYFVFGFTLNAL